MELFEVWDPQIQLEGIGQQICQQRNSIDLITKNHFLTVSYMKAREAALQQDGIALENTGNKKQIILIKSRYVNLCKKKKCKKFVGHIVSKPKLSLKWTGLVRSTELPTYSFPSFQLLPSAFCSFFLKRAPTPHPQKGAAMCGFHTKCWHLSTGKNLVIDQ